MNEIYIILAKELHTLLLSLTETREEKKVAPFIEEFILRLLISFAKNDPYFKAKERKQFIALIYKNL